jgi:HEAT repeat protein
VQSDDPTLVESADEALLRASFAIGPNYASLLRSNLHAVLARHRVLALRGAVRQSLLASDDWLAALLDLDVTVRREALAQVAYVEMNDVGILEEIVILLDDPDPLVVDAAVFALGEHFYANAVEKLSTVATNHDDARCRESAVAALGAIGDDRGRAAVLAALDDKAPVRRRAIVALSNFEGPDIEAALERASEDRDWQVRAAVDQLKTDQD